MKAAPFAYLKARDLDEVFAALEQHGDDAALLAGGQSLVPALNLRMARPALLVDINGLADLGGIDVADGVLRIGALARHAEVEVSPLVARHAPLLAQAYPHVAHRAVRARGTLGGSLAHADPAAEVPACMVALDAELVLASRSGTRVMPAAEFFRGVLDTARRTDEVLVEARIPCAGDVHRHAFAELCQRHGDFAIVGVAAAASIAGGAVHDLRLVVFGCETHPRVSAAAAARAEGHAPGAALAGSVADAVAAEIEPMDDANGGAAIKRRQARALVTRVLGDLFGAACDG